MDHFGIGAAIRGAINIYFRCARQTGRTTSLVESVQDGDRVVFADHQEARRVQRLWRERGVEVGYAVVDPKTPERLFELEYGPAKGRTIFDHSWVEQWYEIALNRASSELDTLAREMSGYGEAHRETKRKMEELARWER